MKSNKKVKKIDLDEKYQPRNKKEMVGNEEIWNYFFKLVESENFKPFLLYGQKGVGKNTAIEIAIELLKSKYPEIEIKRTNGSNDRKLEAVRKKIIPVLNANLKGFTLPRIVFMDEINFLSDVQEALKTPLYDTDAFVFACSNNDPFSNQFDEAFIDRFTVLQLKPVESKDIFKRLKYICGQEKISYEEEALMKIAKESNGSVRTGIKEVQNQSIVYKEIKLQNMTIQDEEKEKMDEIVRLLMLGQLFEARDKAYSLIKEKSISGRIFVKSLNVAFFNNNQLHAAPLFVGIISGEIARAEARIINGGDVLTQLDGLFGIIVKILQPLTNKLSK